MHLRLYKAFLASTLAITLPVSLTLVPKAQATPGSPTVSQETSHAVADPTDCINQPNNEPIAVPYTAVAAAEELIANGVIDEDVVSALNDTDLNVTVVGPQPRALPQVAALAVAGVAWCAKGALSSIVPSALQEMAHRANSNIPPPDWVMSAIFGCAGGPVLGALTSQAMRIKFAGAVLATIIELRNFG